jgi:signal transduction histidine kinase
VPDTDQDIEIVHQVVGNSEQTEVSNEQNKFVIKKRLAKVFEQLHQSNSQEQHSEHKAKGSPAQQQFWFEHKIETTSTSAQLISSIQWMIVICGAIALAFAYWLSTQFNKPLLALKKGFGLLASGDYQSRIKPQGVRDIKTTMKQFNQMVERLEQLSIAEQHYKETAHLAELGEVSRGLAHTLRNPIHTIGLSIERLANNGLTENERNKIVQTIQSKIAHIDNNIKSLLTLTTTGISRTEQVPILAVIQDIVLEYKFAAPKQQHFEIDVDSALTVTGAESEIRSILHTLIINACEASPEGGVVKISAKLHHTELNITVTDEGKGLSENIAKQLFQPHISSKPEGAGMGLYIANRIISLHYQGVLDIHTNDNGKGCSASATFQTGEHA